MPALVETLNKSVYREVLNGAPESNQCDAQATLAPYRLLRGVLIIGAFRSL